MQKRCTKESKKNVVGFLSEMNFHFIKCNNNIFHWKCSKSKHNHMFNKRITRTHVKCRLITIQPSNRICIDIKTGSQ